MTYPESRYLGAKGDISATYRRADHEPELTCHWIDTAPGDFVHVPEGGIHAFRNESGKPASMLLHFAPGAPREGYFEGLIDLAGVSEKERTEFFLRHDTFWL